MIELSRTVPPAAAFAQRAERAVLLSERPGAGQEPLQFAALLCRAQAELASAIAERHLHQALTGRLAKDVEVLIPLHEPLLGLAAEHGPEQLAEQAQSRQSDDHRAARTRLLAYWAGDTTAREDYLTRALLQPYAEVLRAHNVTPDRLHQRGHCPFCGGAAWISVRKSVGEPGAGLRLLGCSLCGTEWNFNRICCPSCFEEDPPRLPQFRTDTYPTACIEGCETCRRYLKSIDLTQDGRAVPPIDDLLSLSLDLWAIDEGFTRIEPGLAGV